LALVKEHTTAATDAGLFVIVDYLVIGFPDGYYQWITPEWGPPDLYDSDFALATDFWDAVSTQIQDPRVVFELWNEPVYEEDELHPSDPNGSKWAQLKPYYEAVISTIRDNGSQSAILATGNHWAYNLKKTSRMTRSRIPTLPTPGTTTGATTRTTRTAGPPRSTGCTGSSRFSLPRGVEPGANAHYRDTAQTFGNKFRDRFLEGRRLHSTAWCWSKSYGPST
jgi:Cellulase (glycosyl hydrolase family 5)